MLARLSGAVAVDFDKVAGKPGRGSIELDLEQAEDLVHSMQYPG